MSIQYQAVGWNRQKKLYDGVVAAGVLGLVLLFAGVTLLRDSYATVETALIRGLGLTAFLLLQLILVIGPLCRLWPRFLPLLYNRRHLGVTMCLVALAHAGFAVFQFHALGDVNPMVSVLISNTAFGSVGGFPFELLGLLALLILVLMAATSHDFWLSVLSPPVWKGLHMMAYIAWALLIAHVALGAVQADPGSALPLVVGAGAVLVIMLHLAAGLREWRFDRSGVPGSEWVDVCAVDSIAENRAKVAMVGGERVAVFRYDGKLSCVSNVCRHQNGPLGEGKIVNGCITCPWHGYQYLPDTGTSPPPFNDRVETYFLRVVTGRVQVNAKANPPGTRVSPVLLGSSPDGHRDDTPGDPFYSGYEPSAALAVARPVSRLVVTMLLLCFGVMVTLAVAQPRFAPAVFLAAGTGNDGPVTGTVVDRPYPVLVVSGEVSGVRQYLLAGPGKHRADMASWDGRAVRVLGNLLRRGNAAMLEVAEITEAPGEAAVAPIPQTDLGVFTVTGEIVDSKCWLGTMNPGQGKTHLACAVRCLSGGLTPLLAVQDSSGRERHLVLSEANGGPMARQRLAQVGRRVTMTGRMIREGDLLFFRVATP